MAYYSPISVSFKELKSLERNHLSMKYNLEQLKNKFNSGEKLNFLFFWGHQPSKDGTIISSCFSQWWLTEFTVEGIIYKSAEHYMMSEKARVFGDEVIREKIISCTKPAEAKSLGRKIKNFNEETWLKHRYDIVLNGSFHKFSQNPKLKEFLLNTSERIIVEASPVDPIWGIGMANGNDGIENPNKWKGLNLLGFALMEAREKLRA
ncbi:MAG: ybiA [Bacteroidetes bacterium]|jgi:ribA/ribD-fused uncharacterized protein|nr:ybiA [Bacteroidota bacterium]